jgi:hypothetical protein
MSETIKENRRPAKRRLLRIVLFLAIPLTLIFFFAVRVVPPVLGRVVDAVSGKSIRGVRVTLEMSHYQGWSVNTELHDNAKSGIFGWFFLSGALRWRGLPLPNFRSYWMTVNGSDQISGLEEKSAATQFMSNPMFNRKGIAVGDKRYFPLTVTFRRHGCDRVWAATCMYMPFSWDISVPLIPVLDDIHECNKIWNPSLRENCRQLNTYRAAFLHMDSYEDVKRAKALCAEVDHAGLSSWCLAELPQYIGGLGYERPIKPEVNELIPDGMFPDFIGGLPVMSNKHCGPRLLLDGQVNCAASYGTVLKTAVSVSIQQWPEGAQKPENWGHMGGNVSEGVRAGGKVFRHDDVWYSGVQSSNGKLITTQHSSTAYRWYSGNTYVEVLFYDPLPQEEQFLSYYLQKFPSPVR